MEYFSCYPKQQLLFAAAVVLKRIWSAKNAVLWSKRAITASRCSARHASMPVLTRSGKHRANDEWRSAVTVAVRQN